LLHSKGAADDVTERTYRSKEEQQKAEKGWLQRQVANDERRPMMAGYCKGKEKEMELGEGMGIEVSSTKDKKKKAKNTKGGKKPEEGSDSPPELIEEKSDKRGHLHCVHLGVDQSLMGAQELYREMSQWQELYKGDGNEDDAAAMKELYREMSQWQERNQFDIEHAKASPVERTRLLSKMRDEVPNKWWHKVITKAMKEVENEMVEESCGAASSNVEVVKADEDVVEVVEVVKANEESGGATSSKCYYKV